MRPCVTTAAPSLILSSARRACSRRTLRAVWTGAAFPFRNRFHLMLPRVQVLVKACAESGTHYCDITGSLPRHSCHAFFVTFRESLATRYTRHVTRHTSHVTRHTSHVTRHTSHVTRHRRDGLGASNDRLPRRHCASHWYITPQNYNREPLHIPPGAKIVHHCGHDCIPWDICVNRLADTLRKNSDTISRVDFFDEIAFAASGGTVYTATNAIFNRAPCVSSFPHCVFVTLCSPLPSSSRTVTKPSAVTIPS
jgi:hypothetical protein